MILLLDRLVLRPSLGGGGFCVEDGYIAHECMVRCERTIKRDMENVLCWTYIRLKKMLLYARVR